MPQFRVHPELQKLARRVLEQHPSARKMQTRRRQWTSPGSIRSVGPGDGERAGEAEPQRVHGPGAVARHGDLASERHREPGGVAAVAAQALERGRAAGRGDERRVQEGATVVEVGAGVDDQDVGAQRDGAAELIRARDAQRERAEPVDLRAVDREADDVGRRDRWSGSRCSRPRLKAP